MDDLYILNCMIGRYICTNYSQVELGPENLADSEVDETDVL